MALNLPYLEVEIADHCNLRCAHCTHHSPYMDRGFYALSDFRRDVELLASAVTVSEIRIMGGEPLLNALVRGYVAALRESGAFARIGLCTNGILLDRANPALFGELDFLDVLQYAIPQAKQVRESTARIIAEHPKLAVRQMSPSHFWYEDMRSRIDDSQIVSRIWNECGLKNCNAIYRGYFVRCVETYRKPAFLNRLGVRDERLEDWHQDAVALDSPTLAADIAALLARPQCLEACNWCLGQSGRDVPHAQRERGYEVPIFDVKMLKWSTEQ